MNVRVLTWNKPRQPTEDELRQLFKKEGMTPYVHVMERNEFTDTHAHNHNETRIILEGEVEFCAEGRMHVLKQGDRIDIKKNTPHTAKNLSRNQAVMLCGNN